MIVDSLFAPDSPSPWIDPYRSTLEVDMTVVLANYKAEVTYASASSIWTLPCFRFLLCACIEHSAQCKYRSSALQCFIIQHHHSCLLRIHNQNELLVANLLFWAVLLLLDEPAMLNAIVRAIPHWMIWHLCGSTSSLLGLEECARGELLFEW